VNCWANIAFSSQCCLFLDKKSNAMILIDKATIQWGVRNVSLQRVKGSLLERERESEERFKPPFERVRAISMEEGGTVGKTNS